jgi:hypothetical protein
VICDGLVVSWVGEWGVGGDIGCLVMNVDGNVLVSGSS